MKEIIIKGRKVSRTLLRKLNDNTDANRFDLIEINVTNGADNDMTIINEVSDKEFKKYKKDRKKKKELEKWLLKRKGMK